MKMGIGFVIKNNGSDVPIIPSLQLRIYLAIEKCESFAPRKSSFEIDSEAPEIASHKDNFIPKSIFFGAVKKEVDRLFLTLLLENTFSLRYRAQENG